MKNVILISTVIATFLFLGCNKKKSSQLPIVSTTSVSDITSIGAKSGGNVTDEGGSPITSKGICWGTTSNPTILDNKTNEGSGTGSFVSTISGLQATTKYFVRAYATNDAGTAYGSDISFTTLNATNGGTTGTVTDIDGNTYQTVTIGTQVWMAENLRTTKYANGDPIPNVTDPTQWESLTSGAWAYYDNDAQHNNPYGKLYNFYAVIDSRNICPVGWHVPSQSEWTILKELLDVNLAGGKMKTTGTIQLGTGIWEDPNDGATNETGFSGVPSGKRRTDGSFIGKGFQSEFWSTSVSSFGGDASWKLGLTYQHSGIDGDYLQFKEGGAVRCIKD